MTQKDRGRGLVALSWKCLSQVDLHCLEALYHRRVADAVTVIKKFLQL